MNMKGLLGHFFLSIILTSLGTTEGRESRFSLETISCLEERKKLGCSMEMPPVRGRVECFVLCGGDVSCIGASLDARGTCFHHQLCPSPVTCAESETSHTYLARHCVQGQWDSSSQSCVCVNAAHGDRCEKFPDSCKELLVAGYSPGIHNVFLDPLQDGKGPVKVFCNVDHDYLAYFIMKNSGKISYNRTWDEYVNGFHLDVDNLWAGLRSLKVLTDAGYRQLVVVCQFSTHTSVYYRYNDFMLQGQESGYSFTFSGGWNADVGSPPYGWSAGDCLARFKDKPFSTWDRDQDGNLAENCASQAGHGWWYFGCDNPCRLLGWGLDDYEATPSEQRLSYIGVDMAVARSLIQNVRITVHL